MAEGSMYEIEVMESKCAECAVGSLVWILAPSAEAVEMYLKSKEVKGEVEVLDREWVESMDGSPDIEIDKDGLVIKTN